MKNVVISINSDFYYGPEEEDRMEFSTDGLYLYESNVGCMSYYESPVTGMDGTRTSICAAPDRVVIDREGTVTSQMVFQQGEKTSFIYNTPYGSAAMGIDTRRIRQNLDESGGELIIDYVVSMEHKVVTRNRFYITVREMGENSYG